MMPRCIFERTNLPIDTEIGRRMEKYDSKTNAELDKRGSIGVCRKISLNISDMKVIQSIFVVEYCHANLIFG